MERYRLRGVATLAAQSVEWLLLALLLAVSIPPVLVRHGALTSVPTLNLIDGSWLLDTSYKASTGVWFGRDVAFTYGPLYQWLSSAPSRWIGLSVGSVFATWYTLPFLTIILATFATARLLMPDAAPWRRTLFVLLAVVFWSPPDVRISVVLLAFAIFLRLTQKAAAPNREDFASGRRGSRNLRGGVSAVGRYRALYGGRSSFVRAGYVDGEAPSREAREISGA